MPDLPLVFPAGPGFRAPRRRGTRPRSGSLCTGIGGLDVAAEHVYGTELAWVAENEPHSVSVIGRHWPGVPNLGDLTVTRWAGIEPVEVLTAGYPCQPFSGAGKRLGAADVRHLWPYIAEAVRVLRPRRVVLENVAGHLSLGLGTVLGDLAEAGYDAEWGVVRASEIGACHRRARVFIVAADPDRERREGPFASVAHRWSGPPGGDQAALELFPTPTAECRRGPGGVREGGPNLQTAVALLPTPEASDGSGGRVSKELGGIRPSGAKRAITLASAIRHSWGRYEQAVVRHAAVFGRPPPSPTLPHGPLSPRFVEWMQGYPDGWCSWLPPTAALARLGNSVCAQQGAAAVGMLEAALQEGLRP